MIAEGKALPGGDHPNIHWIEGSMEDGPLEPPYALIVAAGSLHWMDWDIVMPRFDSVLTPHGKLAIVHQTEQPTPWGPALGRLIAHYSTNRDYRPHNLIEDLTARGLFHRQGEHHTSPVPFRQSIPDYIESIHSRNGFSRERMPAEAAREFDRAVESYFKSSVWTERSD